MHSNLSNSIGIVALRFDVTSQLIPGEMAALYRSEGESLEQPPSSDGSGKPHPDQ